MTQDITDHYRGPGYVTAAWGKYGIYSLVAGLGGAAIGYVVGGRAQLVGAVVGIPAGLYGAYIGLGEVAKAQADHQALVSENKLLKEKLSWQERTAQQQQQTAHASGQAAMI